MVRRRQVLIGGGIGIAAMGSALVPGKVLAAGKTPASNDISLFLIDRSIKGAADIASRTNIPTLQYTDDIGVPWLDRLEPAWRQKPQAVIGVTFAGAFFCLEQLATSYGLVCTFRSALPPTVQASSVRPFASTGRDTPLSRADQRTAMDALVTEGLRVAELPASGRLGVTHVEAGNAPLVWLLQPSAKNVQL